MATPPMPENLDQISSLEGRGNNTESDDQPECHGSTLAGGRPAIRGTIVGQVGCEG
jgi:hypothetical protein